jgi:hypothetical protein
MTERFPSSDYRGTWRSLIEERLVVAVDARYDGSFEDPAACREIARNFFSLLGSNGNVAFDDGCRNLEGVFEAKHESESECSALLFQRLGEALQAHAAASRRKATAEAGASMLWAVDEATKKAIVLVPRPPVVTTREGKEMELAMGLVRGALRDQQDAGVAQTSSRTDHAWAVFERPALPSSFATSRGAGGPEGGLRTTGEGNRDNKMTEDVGISTVDGYVADGKMGVVDGDVSSTRDAGDSGRRSAGNVACIEGTSSKAGAVDSVDLPETKGGRGDTSAAAAGQRQRAKDDGESAWSVRYILAVVNLKMKGKACGQFRTMENDRGARIVEGDGVKMEENEHGPLAQAVMYTLNDALWGRAALGQSELLSTIPTAVLACRDAKFKPKENATGGKNSWALVDLVIPEECGDAFAFRVNSFGNVHDRNFAASSLAAYLYVMTSGMRVSMDWLRGIMEGAGGPPPRPPACMSGRRLNFGEAKSFAPGMELVASPVSKYGTLGYRISQGELFRANLNLGQLKEAAGSHRVFWCPESFAEAEVQEVLIKVTSLPCFNVLVGNTGYLFELGTGLLPPAEIRSILSRSLHGVYVTRDARGMVQVLPSLRSRGYDRLRPAIVVEEEGGWSRLWSAFEEFVLTTLVPLAQARIVHPDIRPGFDETANLLYHSEEGSMVMVDLDSLCSYRSWASRGSKNKRYIKVRELKGVEALTALDFVYLQVVCVAEAWLAGTTGGEVNANDLILRRRGGELLAPSSRMSTGRGDVATVLRDHYRPQFAGRDGGGRRPKKKPRAAAGRASSS